MARVANANTEVSGPSSASATPPHSSCPTPRPGRHHSRSHFQDEERFAASAALRPASSFTLISPRRQSHQGSTSKFHLSSVTASISASSTPSLPPSKTISTASSPSDARVQFPGFRNADVSTDGDDEDADSLTSAAPSLISTAKSVTSFPAQEIKPTASSTVTDDEDRLKKILEAQAKRRPRLMRLTPAFASLPARFSPVSMCTAPSVGRDAKSGIAFPTISAFQSGEATPSPSIADPRRSKGVLEPASLLQLDMTNLPTPSAQASSAPQSTMDIQELRTKSGRLVKPSLKSSSHFIGGKPEGTFASKEVYRTKSTPNTPSLHKAVQFDSNLEHIKVFKFKQRPAAISRSGSPEQTETETEEERDMFPFVNYGRRSSPTGSAKPPAASPAFLSPRATGVVEAEEQLVLRLPNFLSSARLAVDKDVFLERVYLAEDLRFVRGTIRVRNIHFEKWVAVRFTLDNWVTVNEVSADYVESLNEGQSDRFAFSIKLNELLNWPRGAGQHETKTMFLCLRYRTGSKAELWDNNGGENYQLDFQKRQLPATPPYTCDVTGRSTHRSHSISGSTLSSAQERAIRLARQRGIHSGAACRQNGFVDDLRRELDRLKSDEEDVDRPPIQFKKSLSFEEPQFQGVTAKQIRNSPPASPGQRSGSPLWSGRYDWGDALRNSTTASSRARQSVYDYFTAKPAPPQSALMAASAVTDETAGESSTLTDPVRFTLSKPSLSSSESSSAATPTLNMFGPVRAGMFSPAVGDVFAHHQPIDSSAISSLDKFNVPGSGHSSELSTPAEDVSPTGRLDAQFFSSLPQRQDIVSSAVSGNISPAISDGEGISGSGSTLHNSSSVMRSLASRKIITVPKDVLRHSSLTDKNDGLVFENNDNEPSSPPSSTLSPTVSNLSVESDSNTTPGPITPEDATNYDQDAKTPRLSPGRRWSPPFASFARGCILPGLLSTSEAARPRSVTDLSELIQKYCWSSDVTPGTAPLDRGLNDKVESAGGLYGFDMQSPPLSGPATPTLGV